MAKTKKELESELEALVIDYDKRLDRLVKIQADYEQRLDFFHEVVSSLTTSFIGTADLRFALDKLVKFGFAEEYNAGSELAELYSNFNEGVELPYLNNYVCDMVYQAACNKLWEEIPISEECIDFTHGAACYMEFQTFENTADEMEQFVEEVKKLDVERLEGLRGILMQVFEDLDMKESFDFVSKKE